MNVRLECTKHQYDSLHVDADKGRSVSVAVNRRALQALLVDHTKLRGAAERVAEVIEPEKGTT